MASSASSSAGKAALPSAFRAIAHNRTSCNRFQPNQKIPTETVKDILESTIRSPSSFNLQPTQIILVQDPSVKETLAASAMLGLGNQYRTRDCSVLAVFLSDLEASKRIPRIYQLEKDWGKRHPNYMAIMPLSTNFFLGEGHAATFVKQLATNVLSNAKPMPEIEDIQSWAYKNTGLVAQSYVYACASHALSTSIMEGFDARRVKQLLRIPDRYAIPMVVGTGYEYVEEKEEKKDNAPLLTPRLQLKEVVFQDCFGDPISSLVGEDDTTNNEKDDSDNLRARSA